MFYFKMKLKVIYQKMNFIAVYSLRYAARRSGTGDNGIQPALQPYRIPQCLLSRLRAIVSKYPKSDRSPLCLALRATLDPGVDLDLSKVVSDEPEDPDAIFRVEAVFHALRAISVQTCVCLFFCCLTGIGLW